LHKVGSGNRTFILNSCWRLGTQYRRYTISEKRLTFEADMHQKFEGSNGQWVASLFPKLPPMAKIARHLMITDRTSFFFHSTERSSQWRKNCFEESISIHVML
jgi:hypothetical protein